MRHREAVPASNSKDHAPSISRASKAFVDATLTEARDSGQMSGERIISLMRRYRVTIRSLSKRTGITMKRIRNVREEGLADAHSIRDWIEAITGDDPGPMDTSQSNT